MPPFSKFKDILSSYRCQTCGAVFKKDDELRNHLKTHEIQQARSPKYSEPTFMPQFFGGDSCPICGLPLKNKSHKEAHEKEHQELSKNPFLVANHACFYQGGFPTLAGGMVGNLLIYTNPYQLVLKFEKTELILPFDKIKKAQLISKTEDPSIAALLVLGIWAFGLKKDVPYFLLGYENELGDIVEGVFELYQMRAFVDRLQHFRIEYKKLKDSPNLH
jgi:hypothetical protein